MTSMKRFTGLKGFVKNLDAEAQGIVDWEYQGQNYNVKLPFTLPQEEVEWEVVKKRRKKPLGYLVSLLKTSPHRSLAPCPHFSFCGGCRLQHLNYSQQLDYKYQKVLKAFSPYIQPSTLCHPPIGCSPPWEYRNKMSFSFGEDKSGKQYLGLYQRGKRRIINIQECRICPPWMTQVLAEVYQWWETTGLQAYHFSQNTGTLREITLKSGLRTGDKCVILSINAKPEFSPTQKHLHDFVNRVTQLLSDANISIFLKLHQVLKGQPTQVYEMLLNGKTTIKERLFIDKEQTQPLDCVLSPQAFFQPNTLQAERIYQSAFAMLAQKPLGIVYDLYCGTGTLGAFAAKLGAKQVYSVELHKESLMDGEENARENAIVNQHFIWGDVQKVMGEASRREKKIPPPDLIIVDPPRAGLGPKALAHILACQPPHILYISCNPETQAKDLNSLIQDYELKQLQSVDQFPHTLHIENIVLLSKRPLSNLS